MSIWFTEEHEWVTVEDGVATIGITAHAAKELGDVVFVEVRNDGERFDRGDEIGVIESVKAASEFYAPVSGEVVAVNEEVAETPGLVNESPHDDAWLCKIKLSDPAELESLMDEAAYKTLIA